MQPSHKQTSYIFFYKLPIFLCNFLITIFFFYSMQLFGSSDISGNNNIKEFEVKKIKILSINSSINPATFDYINDNLEKGFKDKTNLFIIKLSTPGGLLSTTKDIIERIGTSSVPIVIWVTPEGASATSAGAIICSSAHLLFMSEGTNIGASTPVELGKDIKKSDLRNKAINDLVALVGSLSEARKRSAAPFEKMVSLAQSYKATEALNLKIIDGIVNNQSDLINAINKKEIHLKGEPYTVSIATTPEIISVDMKLGQTLLNIFANPHMAYILFILGAILIYLELQTPGGFIAGGIGTLALVLAGIGFQVLPLNIGAFALLILSFCFFIIEIYIASYGILSIMGLASLVFGSLFLFKTNDSYLSFGHTLVFSVVFSIAIFLIFIGVYWTKDAKRKKKEDFFSLAGQTCVIVEKFEKDELNSFKYQVKIAGEFWNAISSNNYEINQKIKVIKEDKENMKLLI